jgi:hypothetical protein
MGWFKRKGPHAPDRLMPQAPMREVHRAQEEGRDATFHGACISCAWRRGNASGLGLQWCMECAYFNFVDYLPNMRTPMPDVDAKLPEDY